MAVSILEELLTRVVEQHTGSNEEQTDDNEQPKTPEEQGPPAQEDEQGPPLPEDEQASPPQKDEQAPPPQDDGQVHEQQQEQNLQVHKSQFVETNLLVGTAFYFNPFCFVPPPNRLFYIYNQCLSLLPLQIETDDKQQVPVVENPDEQQALQQHQVVGKGPDNQEEDVEQSVQEQVQVHSCHALQYSVVCLNGCILGEE